MKSIHLKSYAKINLSLDVKGILDNGYHELEMIMQQIDLCDEIHVRWTEGDCDGINIMLHTNRPYLPTDEKNLAYRAAMIMAERFGANKKGTIRIDIGKKIPVAAGLAGGSGNGGAVILAMDQLWDLDKSLEELMEIGKEIGSDVPFTMMGMARCCEELPEKIRKSRMASSAAIATYDGTVLQPVAPLDAYIVLSKPPVGVSTKEVYRGIDHVEILQRPDTEKIVRALTEKNPTLVARNMCNVLEFYTLVQYNFIMDTKTIAAQCDGVLGTMMSGSGPTIFSIMDGKDTAEKSKEILRKRNKETFLSHTTI